MLMIFIELYAVVECYAVDDYPERPAGLAPGNAGLSPRRVEPAGRLCLAVNFTMAHR
jgi:hypothetical protein